MVVGLQVDSGHWGMSTEPFSWESNLVITGPSGHMMNVRESVHVFIFVCAWVFVCLCVCVCV